MKYIDKIIELYKGNIDDLVADFKENTRIDNNEPDVGLYPRFCKNYVPGYVYNERTCLGCPYDVRTANCPFWLWTRILEPWESWHDILNEILKRKDKKRFEF